MTVIAQNSFSSSIGVRPFPTSVRHDAIETSEENYGPTEASRDKEGWRSRLRDLNRIFYENHFDLYATRKFQKDVFLPEAAADTASRIPALKEFFMKTQRNGSVKISDALEALFQEVDTTRDKAIDLREASVWNDLNPSRPLINLTPEQAVFAKLSEGGKITENSLGRSFSDLFQIRPTQKLSAQRLMELQREGLPEVYRLFSGLSSQEKSEGLAGRKFIEKYISLFDKHETREDCDSEENCKRVDLGRNYSLDLEEAAPVVSALTKTRR